MAAGLRARWHVVKGQAADVALGDGIRHGESSLPASTSVSGAGGSEKENVWRYGGA